ncbi:MAG: SDR family oxidoreductase [Acidimicrobiia bacterium]|nr:SDR family oxidoreductase [Acidimicrobiia bacterium]
MASCWSRSRARSRPRVDERCTPAADVTDAEACRGLVDLAVRELGGVDILVNNAVHNGTMAGFEGADLETWRKTMDVNFFGTLQLTQAAVPALKQSGNGRIVMINTMSVQDVEPHMPDYAASKGALAVVTKALARELGGHGIRVNGVHPGYIWGPSVEWYFDHLAEERGVSSQQVYDEVAGRSALGYIPHSSELAGTVVYLASDLAKPVTGQSINVSCGTWMQ